MTTKDETISIEYPIRTYWPLVIFSFIATASITLSFLVRTIRICLGQGLNIGETLFGGIAAFTLLQVSLWFFHGRERIDVDADNFIFVRSNGMLTFRKRIPSNKIESVTVNQRTFPSDTFLDKNRQQIKEMQGAIFFWHNMGRLEFKIGNKYKSFFNGLTEQDAKETIRTLNGLIPNHQTDNRNST